jgi:hypothetical protein
MAERASQLTRDMAVTRPPALPTDKRVRPLVLLHRERTVIMGELVVLNVSAARLRQAENAEAAVHREFADLSSAEIDAVANWARTPIGEPPSPDQKLRRALAEKLAAAQSAAATARGAAQDIGQHTAELNQRLIAINVEIEVAVLDAVELEFANVCRQNSEVVDLFRKSSLRISGLCSFLSTEGRRLNDRADTEASKRYLARAEALAAAASKLPKPDVSQVEIAAAANEWGRHVADLRKGSS